MYQGLLWWNMNLVDKIAHEAPEVFHLKVKSTVSQYKYMDLDTIIMATNCKIALPQPMWKYPH